MKSGSDTTAPGAGRSWDSILGLLNAAQHTQIPPALAGFDGFVDTILHVVSERHSPAEYTRLLTLQEFAKRVLAASGGRNMNIEMVTRLTKIGGNGPILSNPKITTGAGDHFNAGLCLGRLLRGDMETNIRLGIATSGYYVRQAHSPTLLELIEFVKTLS
jgi:hypothetical protein